MAGDDQVQNRLSLTCTTSNCKPLNLRWCTLCLLGAISAAATPAFPSAIVWSGLVRTCSAISTQHRHRAVAHVGARNRVPGNWDGRVCSGSELGSLDQVDGNELVRRSAYLTAAVRRNQAT
jgi:hypothetical protein